MLSRRFAAVVTALAGCYAHLPDPPPRAQRIADAAQPSLIDIGTLTVRVSSRLPSDLGAPAIVRPTARPPTLARARARLTQATTANERVVATVGVVHRLLDDADKLPARERIPLLTDAVRVVEDTVKVVPSEPLHRLHAALAIRLGLWAPAVESYAKLARLTPDEVAWCAWAALRAERGDVARALIAAIEDGPASAVAAWTLWQVGKWESAAAMMARFVEATDAAQRHAEWYYMAARATPVAEWLAAVRKLHVTPDSLYAALFDVQHALWAVGRFGDVDVAIDAALSLGSFVSLRDRARLRYLQAEAALRADDLRRVGMRGSEAWQALLACGVACQSDASTLREGISKLIRFVGAIYVTTRDVGAGLATDQLVQEVAADAEISATLVDALQEVKVARALASGGVHDREEASALWSLNRVALEPCAERHLAVGTEANASVSATYDARAKPSHVVVTTTPDSAELAACVQRTISEWSLPLVQEGSFTIFAKLQLATNVQP